MECAKKITSCCWSRNLDEPVENIANTEKKSCLHLKMAPGFVTFMGIVAAIIHAVVLKYYFLCIIYGPAALCALYATYYAWNTQNLKNLVQNVNQFTIENQNLREENEQLKETSSNFKNQVSKLSLENKNLKESNIKLQNTVRRLELFTDQLEEKAKLHVGKLELLEKGLENVQNSSLENCNTFTECLKLFREQITSLKETNNNIEQSNNSTENILQKQTSALSNTAQNLEKLFLTIQDWTNKEVNELRRNEQLSLNKEINNLKEERLLLEKNISKGEVIVEQQSKQIEELKKTKEELDISAENLRKEIFNLGQVIQNMKN